MYSCIYLRTGLCCNGMDYMAISNICFSAVFAGFLQITWVLISIWIDIIFTPLEFIYNKINSYLKQKELENDRIILKVLTI